MTNCKYPTASKRWLFLCVGLAVILAASAQRVVAAEANTVRKHIEDLSAPNVMTRFNACTALGQVGSDDVDVAVDALLGALNDVSGTVRNAAVMAMEKTGPGAKKAIPRIIECYQRDTVSKVECIRAVGRIGPDSPEAIDFLTEVVRGGKSGAIRPLNSGKPPTALRQEAILTLGKIGPKAKKCIPVLLDVLNVAAVDITRHEQTFVATVDAVSVIGVGNKRVVSTLKRFQQGKGFRPKSTGSQAREHAVVAADSAVKRLEKADEASAAEQEKDE